MSHRQPINQSATGLTDVRLHAHEASEASSLGICIVGEILNYLRPLHELGNVAALPDNELRSRCAMIEGLAQMAVRFSEDMDGLLKTVHEGHTRALASIDAARKGATA